MLAPPHAASCSPAEASGGGVRTLTPRRAAAPPVAHPAARDGLCHRYAQPYQWDIVRTDKVGPYYQKTKLSENMHIV